MTEKVLCFASKKKESAEQKRRNFERIVFQNFLGAYSVLDKNGVIYPVVLVDISKGGCLFQVPWDAGSDVRFETGTETTLRMYFTQESYIPIVVKVKRSEEYYDDSRRASFMRYGCEFDRSLKSFKALKSFIEFMDNFAEHSVNDKGDVRLLLR